MVHGVQYGAEDVALSLSRPHRLAPNLVPRGLSLVGRLSRTILMNLLRIFRRTEDPCHHWHELEREIRCSVWNLPVQQEAGRKPCAPDRTSISPVGVLSTTECAHRSLEALRASFIPTGPYTSRYVWMDQTFLACT